MAKSHHLSGPRRRSWPAPRRSKYPKNSAAALKRKAVRVTGPISARSIRPNTTLVAQAMVARLTKSRPTSLPGPACLVSSAPLPNS